MKGVVFIVLFDERVVINVMGWGMIVFDNSLYVFLVLSWFVWNMYIVIIVFIVGYFDYNEMVLRKLNDVGCICYVMIYI